MPTDMTSDELEQAKADATEVDTFDYRNDADDDDYVSLVLYKTAGGRHFRYISSSGFNNAFSGVVDSGQWLADEEVADWKTP